MATVQGRSLGQAKRTLWIGEDSAQAHEELGSKSVSLKECLVSPKPEGI